MTTFSVVNAQNVILATGHSARDIFYLLNKKEIAIKAKSFAMGVRVEHPQHIIDSIQYHCSGSRPALLPAASYGLVEQIKDRGVYSFCMCPGGFIVPAATANGEVVVNGMSPSRRNNKFANSGIVVEINIDYQVPPTFVHYRLIRRGKRRPPYKKVVLDEAGDTGEHTLSIPAEDFFYPRQGPEDVQSIDIDIGVAYSEVLTLAVVESESDEEES